MAWADATVWSAVLASPAARADTAIRRTLHHIHLVQHIFLQAWTQQPVVIRPDTDFSTVESLAAYGRSAHQGVLAYVAQASPATLAGEFREPWPEQFEARWGRGPAAVHTLGESLLQVPMHTAHHRGQVCTRLREVGVAPPTIDFIVWLWGGRPEPDWTALAASPATRFVETA
jgi:uncharacterized damage-inducible protein DinB